MLALEGGDLFGLAAPPSGFSCGPGGCSAADATGAALVGRIHTAINQAAEAARMTVRLDPASPTFGPGSVQTAANVMKALLPLLTAPPDSTTELARFADDPSKITPAVVESYLNNAEGLIKWMEAARGLFLQANPPEESFWSKNKYMILAGAGLAVVAGVTTVILVRRRRA